MLDGFFGLCLFVLTAAAVLLGNVIERMDESKK
jgi:hypothetical protein